MRGFRRERSVPCREHSPRSRPARPSPRAHRGRGSVRSRSHGRSGTAPFASYGHAIPPSVAIRADGSASPYPTTGSAPPARSRPSR
ncbi:hypothetical protein EIK56_01265 [Sphingomonas sp. C8-2]|nr:hypothetical protein EIK56_01265 [Sphingomonas sp. C8-2]